MRENWRRRSLIGTPCTAGMLGFAGCGADDSLGPAAQPTQTETGPTTGTPAQTTPVPQLVAKRTELSWFLEPGGLFDKENYGVYLYHIPRLRDRSPTLQAEPIEDFDLTPDDISHLGIGLDQLESLMKIDGITRSEAEVVLFFGSFDPTTRPSVEGGELVSTSEYQDHTLYRLSGGDLGIAVGPHTIILARETGEKDPLAAARSPIEASLGEMLR